MTIFCLANPGRNTFVRAFTSIVVVPTTTTTTTTTTRNNNNKRNNIVSGRTSTNTIRFLSSGGVGGTSANGGGGMPYGETEMPYYALGVNLAMQVGGQGNIKTLLQSNELELVLQGFCDNLRGQTNERSILQTYGPALNQILQDRSNQLMQKVLQEGQVFIQQFMTQYPQEAKQTARYVFSPPLDSVFCICVCVFVCLTRRFGLLRFVSVFVFWGSCLVVFLESRETDHWS